MKEKDGLISIIIPIYNLEKYIGKCIESVISQTYENIEIILVDDGSKDNSGMICDDWSKKDKRIKVIHQKNSGVSVARNRGLEEATGEYIGFVDGDDYIDSKMFEILYDNIVKTNSDISICDYKVIKNGKTRARKHNLDEQFIVIDNHDYFFELLVEDYFKGFTWNKLFKTSVVKDNKFDREIAMCEDLLFVTQTAINSNKICYDTSGLYYYCIRDGSAAREYNLDEKTATIIDAYERIVEILEREKIRSADKYRIVLFNYENIMIHEVRFDRYREKVMKKKEKDSYNYIMKNAQMSYNIKLETFIRYRFYKVYALLKKIKKMTEK